MWLRFLTIFLLCLSANANAKEKVRAQCPGWSAFEKELPPCPYTGSRPPEDMPVVGLLIPNNGQHIPESDVINIAFESLMSNPKAPESDLQYFEARYYAGNLGKFNSADPMACNVNFKSLVNPQNHNLYAYGLNNPFVFIDSTGKYADTPLDVISLGMGIHSISTWDTNTSFLEKALDVGGVILVTPGVVVGASAAIIASKGAKVADKITDIAKVAKSETTLDLLNKAQRLNSGTLKVDNATLQKIGKAEARGGKAFSGLKAEIVQSKPATWQGKPTGGQQTVTKYIDPSTGLNKFTVHTVTDSSGSVIHRDFDSVLIKSGQQVVK